MAILPVERSMCNKMVYDFDGQIGPAQASKGAINDKKNQLQTLLNTLTSSSQAAIDNGISTLTSQVDNIIPGATLSSMRELKNFIEKCAYLSGLSPIAALLGAIDAIYDAIDDLLDNLGFLVPEFNLGKLASAINDLLKGGNTPNLLSGLDDLLNCLSLYCGGEYPSQISDFSNALDQAYTDLNITSNPASPNYGLFDFDSMYDQAGLTTTQRAQVNQVTASVDGEKDRAKSTIMSAIDIYKENLL